MLPDHTNIGKFQEICRLLSKLIYPANFLKKFPGLIIIMESFWDESFRIFWSLTKGYGFTKKNYIRYTITQGRNQKLPEKDYRHGTFRNVINNLI